MLHFLVDCLCLCCLYLTALDMVQMMTIFVTYNVCAFLTQPLTGWLADRMKQRHWMLLGADGLLAVAVLGAGVVESLGDAHTSEWLMLGVATLLGLGNSLFHVWGGKEVARQTGNDIRALGVFVSTGAFGLAVGAVFASWGLLYLLLLFICLLSVTCIRMELKELGMRNEELGMGNEELGVRNEKLGMGWDAGVRVSIPHSSFLIPNFPFLTPHSLFPIGVVAAMMLAVAIRSFAGESYTTGIDKTPLLLLTLGATSMLGKMAGGWLVRGLGMVRAIILMVVGATLCWMVKSKHLALMLLGLFLVNCTMPVTLYWTNAALKGREGLAFGLLAAALMPGYLMATSATASHLLAALIPTIFIELGVLWLLKERRKKVLLSSVAVNMLTNVPLNLYLIYVNDGAATILMGEAIVVLVEALWYYAFTRHIKQACIYSILCNAISFLIGLLLFLMTEYFIVLTP